MLKKRKQMKKITVYVITLFFVPLYASNCKHIVSFLQMPDRLEHDYQHMIFDDRGEETSLFVQTDLDLYRRIQEEKAEKIKSRSGIGQENLWIVREQLKSEYIRSFDSALHTDKYAISGGYFNSKGSKMPLYQILINEGNVAYLLPLMRYMREKNFRWTSFNDDAVAEFVSKQIPFREKDEMGSETRELLQHMKATYSLDTRGNNEFASIVFRVASKSKNKSIITEFFPQLRKRKRSSDSESSE